MYSVLCTKLYQDTQSTMISYLSALASSEVDISATCDYLTFNHLPWIKVRREEVVVDVRRKRRSEDSPAMDGLNSATAQLLEEEIDNIDCPSRSGPEEGEKPVLRPVQLTLATSFVVEGQDQDWQLLDLSHGAPLVQVDTAWSSTSRPRQHKVCLQLFILFIT